MNKDTKIILASQSPRRLELFRMTGLDFDVDVPDVDETCSLSAGEAVIELSCRKAQAVMKRNPGCVVLAADTLVSVGGHALGKPANADEAFEMLRMLRGRWHEVFTGVAVCGTDGTLHQAVCESGVHFCHMTDEEIRTYISTGEPMDKAGSYAVQGIAGMWIDEIRGSYSNIVGLPMVQVRELLAECGICVPSADRN